jgi:hypothetical protein
MAEALLQHALRAQEEPLRSLKVISAGVAARFGEPISENSVVALRKVGIDATRHTSQPLTPKLVGDALAIFCMTESHRAMIQLAFDPPPQNLFLPGPFRRSSPALRSLPRRDGRSHPPDHRVSEEADRDSRRAGLKPEQRNANDEWGRP